MIGGVLVALAIMSFPFVAVGLREWMASRRRTRLRAARRRVVENYLKWKSEQPVRTEES